MAVRIRLMRMGAKKRPSYRIVVMDSRVARGGKVIERIGHYDPIADPVVITIDREKALDWMSKGAQCSETVKALFGKTGILKAPAE